MRTLDIHVVRLFVHVLAATVWVGGQFALAGLLPTLRSLGDDAPRAAARAFNRLAWPAFAVLVVTGLWNVAEADVTSRSTDYQVVLLAKIAVVALSGAGAAVHVAARSKLVLALGGAAGGLGALAALFLGVWLNG